MGMDSKKLSAREKQPGDDRTFTKSEANFIEALHAILKSSEYEIIDKPAELRKMFSGEYGIVPEASIRNRATGRVMYFEVKKQGDAGNADERACKHHTVQFQKTLASHLKVNYHAFCTIMCESLATNPRYTKKHPFFFEPSKHFLWIDYDIAGLRTFLANEVLPVLSAHK
jgi:hypothetical protein